MTEKLVLSPMEEINSLNAVVDPSAVKRVAVSNERINGLGRVVAVPVQAAAPATSEAAPVGPVPVVPPVQQQAPVASEAVPVGPAPVVPPLTPEAPVAPISSGVSQGVVDAVNNFYNEDNNSLAQQSLENPISSVPGMTPSFEAPQSNQNAVPSLNPLDATGNMAGPAPSSFVPEYRPEPIAEEKKEEPMPAPMDSPVGMNEPLSGGSLGTKPSSFVPEYHPEPIVEEKKEEPMPAPMGSPVSMNETLPGGSLGSEPIAPAENSMEKVPQPDMISMSEDDEIMNLRAILESTKRAAEEQEIRTEMAIEYLDKYLESKKSMSR